MLREEVRPASEADAAILAALTNCDEASLAALGSAVPPILINRLKSTFEAQGESEPWGELAAVLERGGFRASAVNAYIQWEWREANPASKGAVHAQLSNYFIGLGMAGNAAIHRRVANRCLGVREGIDPIPELESGELYVMASRNDKEAYLRVLEDLGEYELCHDPLRDPWNTKAVVHSVPPGTGQPIMEDCSFFVMGPDGLPIVQVEADVWLNRHVGCRQTGIVLTILDKAHPLRRMAEQLAVRQLGLILEWSGAPSVVFDSGESTVLCPEVRGWILEPRTIMVPYSGAWVDLGWDADRIEANYRDAHRQSLRWGRRNVVVSSCKTPDEELFQAYEEVFARVGRPPANSTEYLASCMGKGMFTLYIGKVEGVPAVALLSSRHGKTTYYWASVKVPVGNKPLAHVVLHQAIMDAKAEGQTRFDFGQLQDSEVFNQKLHNIALYKRGFATHTERRCLHHALPNSDQLRVPNSM